MGLDPATWAIIGSTIVNAGANYFGAQNQSNVADANLQSQLQNRQMLQGYVGQMMRPGMNPYSNALLNFMGQAGSVNPNWYNFNPYGGGQQGAAPLTGSTVTGQQGSGGATGNPGGSGDPTELYNLIARQPSMPYMTLGNDTSRIYGDPAPSASASSGTGGTPNIPGYTGGWTPAYGSVGGVDLGQYRGQGLTIRDLLSQGVLTPEQVKAEFGPDVTSPEFRRQMEFDYNNWLSTMSNLPGASFGTAGPPSLDEWINRFSLLNTSIDAYAPRDEAALQQAFQNLPKADPGGWVDNSGVYHPPNNGPGKYVIGGQYYDNPQGTGTPLGPANFDPATGLPVGPGAPMSTGIPAGGGGGGGGMYRYQSPGAFTYTPQLAGNAPLVSGVQDVMAPQVNAQTIGGIQPYNPMMVQGPSAITPMMLGDLPQLSVNPINSPTGTQGFNTGQDGLLQMMNRQFNPSQMPELNTNLLSLAGGEAFDNSDLFAALEPLDNKMIEKQVGGLHASAGSLGQRFGGAMAQDEALLRSDLANQIQARNAQIQQSTFENAQNRRLQALGQLGTLQQANSQFGLAGAGLNLQAAQAAAGNALQGGQLNLQAQIENARNALNAGQFNLQSRLQTGLANQGAGLQAAQLNAGYGLQASQMNQAAGLQAGLAGQDLLSRIAMQNASNNLQGQQIGGQFALQAGQGNQQARLQAALANQNALSQFALQNAGIMNQAAQFNAGQRTTADQFTAGQGNIYNQLMMQGFGQAANLQQGQDSYNAGLLGILAGVPVPQAMPSPIPGAIADAAGTASMLPFLLQMYRQNSTPSWQSYTPNFQRAPSTYY